jgi:hypothetical protein
MVLSASATLGLRDLHANSIPAECATPMGFYKLTLAVLAVKAPSVIDVNTRIVFIVMETVPYPFPKMVLYNAHVMRDMPETPASTVMPQLVTIMEPPNMMDLAFVLMDIKGEVVSILPTVPFKLVTLSVYRQAKIVIMNLPQWKNEIVYEMIFGAWSERRMQNFGSPKRGIVNEERRTYVVADMEMCIRGLYFPIVVKMGKPFAV